MTASPTPVTRLLTRIGELNVSHLKNSLLSPAMKILPCFLVFSLFFFSFSCLFLLIHITPHTKEEREEVTIIVDSLDNRA